MNIKVYTKNVYGNELVYPACDKAKLLLSLTNKKTFDERDLSAIRSLGYSIELVFASEAKQAVKVLVGVKS